MTVTDHVLDAETTEGAPVAERKVLAWLGKITGGLETESEVDVSLFQMVKREGETIEERLQDFTFDPAEDDLKILVRDIISAAVDDVEEQKKSIRYVVRVDGRDDKKTFTLKANRPRNYDDEDLDDDEDFDEPPTAKGQVALALDQSFRFAKLSLKESRENRKMDREAIRAKDAEIARLQRQIADYMRVIERAHSQQYMRDLELKKLEKSEQRKEQIVGGVMQVGLPALVAHLSGGKVPAGAFMRPPSPPSPPAPSPTPATASPAPPGPAVGASPRPVSAQSAPTSNGAAPTATPTELVRLAYDKRTGEEIDALMRMIQPEQLPAIQATDVFTSEQKEKLVEIFKTRFECNAACSGG